MTFEAVNHLALVGDPSLGGDVVKDGEPDQLADGLLHLDLLGQLRPGQTGAAP